MRPGSAILREKVHTLAEGDALRAAQATKRLGEQARLGHGHVLFDPRAQLVEARATPAAREAGKLLQQAVDGAIGADGFGEEGGESPGGDAAERRVEDLFLLPDVLGHGRGQARERARAALHERLDLAMLRLEVVDGVAIRTRRDRHLRAVAQIGVFGRNTSG
jgi:hypothetical protein